MRKIRTGYYTPAIIAKFKKIVIVSCVREDVEQLELSHTASGNVKMGQPLWKTTEQLLIKFNTHLRNGPEILLLDICPYGHTKTSP